MARSTRHGALVDALVMRLRGWRMAHQLPGEAGAAREPDVAGRTWYRIENKAADTGPATIHLYDEIGMWGVSADMFMTDLAEIGSRDLLLRINSPGGEVFDGVAIYNALQRHAGSITAHVDGLAASAASFIAMAADEIVMESGSQMMIHDAQGMCWGNEADARALADMLGRTSGTIALIYSERAGGTADEWRERMRAETWYDGAGAVAAKLADRVGESRQRDTGAGQTDGQKAVSNRVDAGQTDMAEGQPRDPHSGRWTDGMPDAIASYAFATTAGALTAVRTREGVELSDGANSVTLSTHERRRIERAMQSGNAGVDMVINRHTEIDGNLHSVSVARVRSMGDAEDADGELRSAGMRLDIGEVEDSDDYDSRTGALFSTRQAEAFEDTLGLAEVSERVQTGYGPLDMYPTSDGKGMTLRMKAESGYPTEVSFSRQEWARIDTAIDTLIDGFDENTPEGAEVNAITVSTKAGKVDLEWKGPRRADGGYAPESRLLITPQYDAPWSVVIDGEHMSDAFGPISMINEAIGVNNVWRPRMRRRPQGRPRAFRSRPHVVDGHVDQLRGEDGRWVDMPGTGVEWDRYTDIYDVYDETSTRSGLTIVTMADGDMQFAWDDAEDESVRHVMLDFAADDNGPAELRDALRDAVDSETIEEFELDEPDSDGIWARVTRNAETVTLFIPGTVEKNDFEIEIDLDEAEELIDALDTQIGNFNDLVDRGQVSATWTGLVTAWYAATDPTLAESATAWAMPEWADAHSTSEPVSSSTDDQTLWKAFA
jgi:ATP-dependent protease ClpP protease subunit